MAPPGVPWHVSPLSRIFLALCLSGAACQPGSEGNRGTIQGAPAPGSDLSSADPEPELRTASDGALYHAREGVIRPRPGVTRAALVVAVEAHGGVVLAQNGLFTQELGYYRIRVPNEIDDVLTDLEQQGLVSAAERNYVKSFEHTPNDPDFSRLWGTQRIGAETAWDSQLGAANVLVAVLDTGVHRTHPDLAASIWINPGEIANNGKDDDANGFVDDVSGWDFASRDSRPDDGHGHGTHVSGTIAGTANNGQAIAGVAFGVKILPVRVCGSSTCFATDFAEGLLYAARIGARVANASLGGAHPPLEYERAAILAFGEAGGVLVAAAGNNASDVDAVPFYPAAYPLDSVISVAASTVTDSLANFSNYGRTSVDLAAPGVDILSTVPSGTQSMSGTSMAAPHVAGAAALILSADPTSDPLRVRQLLLGSTVPVPSLSGRVATGGRLSLARIFGACDPTEPNCGTEPSDPCAEGSAGCSPDAECRNLPSGAVCTCRPGYEGNGIVCVEVDECASELDDCDIHAECRNLPGSYECSCPSGYEGDGKECEAIDPCESMPCDRNADCMNPLPGEFSCSCRPGLSGDGTRCDDLDECSAGESRCPKETQCTNLPGGYFCEGQTPEYPAPDVDECALGLDACDANATCFNTDGSYTCICEPGYAGDGFFCQDIDECTPSLNACDERARCENSEGGFRCECSDGFQGDGFNCVDANECLDKTHRCDVHADCKNLFGAYGCDCQPGFAGDGFTCQDIDECKTGEFDCGPLKECVNQPGGYGCRCRDGYFSDGIQCVDADECALGTDICDPRATCENAEGAYRCACNAGFEGDGTRCTDRDECATGSNDCHPDAICSNQPGSYGCSCPAGFEGSGRVCTDIDECARGTDDCGDNTACQNLHGSFACQCNPGFSGDGRTCSDVDECTNLGHDCDGNAVCMNQEGAYSCSCKPGYSGSGRTCKDVDECALGTDNCHADANCQNSDGGFSCSCKDGFEGNGVSCADIDECGRGWEYCGEGGSCKNTHGSSVCVCKPGFRGDGGKKCVDLDECALGTDNCAVDANCLNLEGSFNCACPSGFEGDGKVCSDIDECHRGLDDCSNTALCLNQSGSFSCQCPDGWQGDGRTCTDVDECARGLDDCSTDASCTNQPGSFSCNCSPGFVGNGRICTDIDECANRSAACDPQAFCENRAGSYSCRCPTGFEGDGSWCRDKDECARGTHSCGSHGDCNNTPGGYRCSCDPGYGGPNCTDLDECQNGTDDCDARAICNNTDGSFRCSCPPGFEGDGKRCTDLNECARGEHRCAPGASCSNQAPGYTCRCPEGTLGDGFSCDLDECSLGVDNCPASSECQNSVPGFRCVCPSGTEGNGYQCADVDECARGLDECDARADCVNQDRGYSCVCHPGLIQVGSNCLDEPDRLVLVRTSADHTCALTDTGLVRCFGLNTYGQLGLGHQRTIGDNESASEAGYVDLGRPAVEIAVGVAHSCALLDDGSVRCWGRNRYGQLGQGNTRDLGDDEAPASAPTVDLGGFAVSITAGGEHTCAVLETGQVRCFGLAVDGQLGYGTIESVGDDEHPSEAGDVPLGDRVVSVTAGRDHTCALLEEGRLSCFGRATWGALGYGNTENIGDNEPAVAAGEVFLGERVSQVDAGWYHTCALLETGAVRCFGYGGAGQLGLLDTQNIGDDEAPSVAEEVDVGGPVVQVSAGLHHTCALTISQGVRCWGLGDNGRLGYANPETIGVNSAPSVAGDVDLGGPAQEVTAGAAHSCALMAEGFLRCWGNGSLGQLGGGFTRDIGDDETPIGARPVLIADVDECAISTDRCDEHARCADTDSGYTCTCEEGFVGDGTLCSDLDECALNTDDCGELAQCSNRPGGYSCSCNPGYQGDGRSCADIDECQSSSACDPHARCENQVGSYQCACEVGYRGDGLQCAKLGRHVTGLAAGAEHTCALLNDGNVRCWGNGVHGRLGYGNSSTVGDDETPASAGDVDLGAVATQIVAGAEHTCALLTDGGVRCWGRGSSGQLGYGNTSSIGDDETPRVAGSVNLGRPVVQLAAGAEHTCALLDTGRVRCWGAAGSGRLGYGNLQTIGDNELPSQAGDVDLGVHAVRLAAGRFHTCALLSGGAVRCWGFGQYGQLGRGNTATIGDDETPRLSGNVELGATAIDLTVGDYHSCAVLDNGALRCWGYAHYGQLGFGQNRIIGDDEPVWSAGDVPLGGHAVRVVAGQQHTCALLEGGKVRCFGYGLDGALGTATVLNIGDDELASKGTLAGAGGFVFGLTAGARHNCALLSDRVRCWGLGTFGRLGHQSASSIGDDELPSNLFGVSITGIDGS